MDFHEIYRDIGSWDPYTFLILTCLNIFIKVFAVAIGDNVAQNASAIFFISNIASDLLITVLPANLKTANTLLNKMVSVNPGLQVTPGLCIHKIHNCNYRCNDAERLSASWHL